MRGNCWKLAGIIDDIHSGPDPSIWGVVDDLQVQHTSGEHRLPSDPHQYGYHGASCRPFLQNTAKRQLREILQLWGLPRTSRERNSLFKHGHEKSLEDSRWNTPARDGSLAQAFTAHHEVMVQWMATVEKKLRSLEEPVFSTRIQVCSQVPEEPPKEALIRRLQ